jgi:hypothetical protein
MGCAVVNRFVVMLFILTMPQLVDPLDLAASFGACVVFKRATVEITDDPVTKVIETLIALAKNGRDAFTLLPVYPGHRNSDAPSPTFVQL